jgi:hypothetical protein
LTGLPFDGTAFAPLRKGYSSMATTQFYAVPPQLRLRVGRARDAPGPRELLPVERRAIHDLSLQLEDRTLAWMDRVNTRGDWEQYYSYTAHYWFEEVARADGGANPPPRELFLRYGPRELYCMGVDDWMSKDRSFLGLMDHDDIDTNLDLEPFLREYVRRLSALVPDLLWCWGYRGDAYWRGLPVSVVHRWRDYPLRTAPRRDRIPRHVMEALGGSPPLPPEKCQLCGRADHGVTPQLLSGAVAPAHEKCFKMHCRDARGGTPDQGTHARSAEEEGDGPRDLTQDP